MVGQGGWQWPVPPLIIEGWLYFGSQAGQRVYIFPDRGTDVVSALVTAPTESDPYFTALLVNRDGTQYVIESTNLSVLSYDY